LLPLWAWFYRGRGMTRFAATAGATLGICWALARRFPAVSSWGQALGARTLAEVGLMPGVENPSAGSFWNFVDPSYRLPVLIGYLAMALVLAFWPSDKNLGELIALSAALLVGSQFWYLDEGGTLVLMYLPLILLMIFRPNLAAKKAPMLLPRGARGRPLEVAR
jgi:hypothetical protein